MMQGAIYPATAIVILTLSGPAQAQSPRGAQGPGTGIEYSSVAAALAALSAKPGAEVSNQHGWTIVTDPAEMTIWSFTPADHSAHPSVVRRQVHRVGEEVRIRTNVSCEATRAACDSLVAEFDALTAAAASQLTPPR